MACQTRAEGQQKDSKNLNQNQRQVWRREQGNDKSGAQQVGLRPAQHGQQQAPLSPDLAAIAMQRQPRSGNGHLLQAARTGSQHCVTQNSVSSADKTQQNVNDSETASDTWATSAARAVPRSNLHRSTPATRLVAPTHCPIATAIWPVRLAM